jgi:hypothetical protein
MYTVNANSEIIVQVIDKSRNLYTIPSKASLFFVRIIMEESNIIQIIYSLLFLKSVSPSPSTKHTGNIFHVKIDNIISVVTTVQILKRIYAFTCFFDLMNIKATKRIILSK